MKPMPEAFFTSSVNAILSCGLSQELQFTDETDVGNLVCSKHTG